MSTLPAKLFQTKAEMDSALAALPLILAGPMVRRVEPTSVSVWVALKQSAQVTLKVWRGYKDAPPAETRGDFETIPVSTLKVGANLHLALVTLTKDNLLPNSPAFELQENTVYSYDLVIGNQNLASLNLLKAPVLLGFTENQLPSFVAPPRNLSDLRIAHGSCRKPHGRGDDGIATLARLLKNEFSNETNNTRPHVFFHTGDQIYADDVSGAIMPYINQAGNMLLGKVERHPYPADIIANPAPGLKEDGFPKEDPAFVWLKNTPHFQPPSRRRINRVSGFTGDQSNHLISLGEFCACYLMQWSEVLWPKDLFEAEEFYRLQFGNIEADPAFIQQIRTPGDDLKRKLNAEVGSIDQAVINRFKNLATTKPELYTLLTILFEEAQASGEDGLAAWNDAEKMKTPFQLTPELKKAFEGGSRKHAINFHATLPDARRMLANVSSLMIFDDHDVTDDWYLTKAWKKQVLNTLPGRTIIRNGLMAFAMFQAWGNTPKEFANAASGYGKLLAAIPGYVDTFEDFDPAKSKEHEPAKIKVNSTLAFVRDQQLSAILGMGIGENAADLQKPELKWHFNVKIGPAMAVVLDTRTQREYSRGAHLPPNLIHKDVLATQIPFDKKPEGVELFLIISGAPVLGLQTIEQIGQRIVPRVLDGIRAISDTPGARQGHESLDVEAWGTHEEGFERLLTRCYALQNVVFLSGDVHYGIASVLDYWKKDDTKPMRMVQLVSSSLKNKKPEGQLTSLLSNPTVQTLLAEGLSGEFGRLEVIGWNKKAGIKIRIRDNNEIGGANFSDVKPGQYPSRIDVALNREPVIVSLRDWPKAAFNTKGQPISLFKADENAVVLDRLVFTNTPDHRSPKPDWRWRLQLIPDARPDRERLACFPDELKASETETNPVPDYLPANPANPGYADTLNRIFTRSYLTFRNHLSRRVNWFTHSALVRFPKPDPGATQTVEHLYLFFPDHPASMTPVPRTNLSAEIKKDNRFFGLDKTNTLKPFMMQVIPLEATSEADKKIPDYPLETDPAAPRTPDARSLENAILNYPLEKDPAAPG